MKLMLVLFSCAIAFDVAAQNSPLQAKGPIPKEFVTKSSEKYLEGQQSLVENDEKQTRKIKTSFYLKSTFSLDNLLKSGYVLFNDSVTAYVNKVAQEILKSNPEVRKDIRFYTLKSTIANAFSTTDGVVLVSLGLIAQLENEAQLAFILCHEISHILEQHALANYMHVEEVKKGTGVYKELSFDEKIVEQLSYSKENEHEADLKGFALFSNTKYAYSELNGAFDVLQYAHLPIDNIPFNYALLESENLLFPDEYKITDVNSIKTEDEIVIKESTHPSVTSRREAIQNAMSGKSNEGRQPFILSATDFKNVRNLARYEMMRLYIADRDYETAIYHASVLLEKNDSVQYIEEALGRALYALAFYSKGHFSEVHLPVSKTEGYLHQTALLFDNLSKNKGEAAIVALRYMLELNQKYPDNPSTQYYIKRLVKLLVQKFEIKWDYFLSETRAEAQKKAEEILQKKDSAQVNNEELTKYEKIKSQQVIEAPVVYYAKYALAEYKSDTTLSSLFKKYESASTTTREYTAKEKKAIARSGYALNIDTIIMFDPIYALIDQGKKESYRYLESERGQETLVGSIEEIAEDMGLQTVLLETGKLDTNDIERFNDFAFLNEYINERLSHPEDIEVSAIERERILAFAEKHGTPFVNLSALVYLKRKAGSERALLIGVSVPWPFLLPFTIPRMISAGKNCYYLNLLYNIKTDRLVFTDVANINSPDKKPVINSHLYHTLRQIKGKKSSAQ